MKGIFGFLAAFCVTSVALGAIYILIPETSFKKPLKYAFCICFLCTVLSGFSLGVKNVISFSPDTFKTDISDFSEETAKLTLKSALDISGIKYKDLSLKTSKNVSGGIDIIEVTVYSSEPEEKIIEAIGNSAYEVKIINE